MGLDSFKTEGPRTRTPDTEKSQQTKLGKTRLPEYATKFEDQFGVPLTQAENDPKFFAERIKDGDGFKELADYFRSLPYHMVDMVVEAVDEGHLDLDEVPDIDHPHYNGKHLKFYVKERIRNKTLDGGSPEPDSEDKSGLESFMT